LHSIAFFSAGIVARGVHWLIADNLVEAPRHQKLLQQSLNDLPVIMFANGEDLSSKDLERMVKSHSFSQGQSLHPAVHLLTSKRLTAGTVLVRFAHLFEKDEDPSYGLTVEEEAGAFLQRLGCKGPAVEVTASGNQNLSTAMARRRSFSSEISVPGTVNENMKVMANDTYELNNWKITLQPMEVRTFKVDCPLMPHIQ